MLLQFFSGAGKNISPLSRLFYMLNKNLKYLHKEVLLLVESTTISFSESYSL